MTKKNLDFNDIFKKKKANNGAGMLCVLAYYAYIRYIIAWVQEFLKSVLLEWSYMELCDALKL